MPYVVVIYAGNRERAQRIVDRYSAGDAGTVAGLYRFPSSKDVECPGWRCEHVENKRYGYGRHPRYGHIVHGGCHRRERGFRERVHRVLMDLFGINMLPRDATPKVFRNPDGYDLR